MKKIVIILLVFLGSIPAPAQVEFLVRREEKAGNFDPFFEYVREGRELIAFRTLAKRAFSTDRVLQYTVFDDSLNSKKGLLELPVKQGYDMRGYDVDTGVLYVLLQQGTGLGAPRYILKVNLESGEGKNFPVNNLLDQDLVEFLVQNDHAIFMGVANMRPVVQVLDLNRQSIYTLQGVYGKDTQLLQIRKMTDLEAFDLVLKRKGQYRTSEVIINTYDLQGNLVREVRVDQFGSKDQEIIEAMIVQDGRYRTFMLGAYGISRGTSYQGMYLLSINEFGEYSAERYTLEDFPNFYNYLEGKSKERKDREVIRRLEKGKIPTIRNKYVIREVLTAEDGMYIYFDQYDPINSRESMRNWPFSPVGMYRYGNWSRALFMNGLNTPLPMDARGTGPLSARQMSTEYNYKSAHFVKIGKNGQILWENATSYDDFLTEYPRSFGEIATIGDEFYHAYVRNDRILLSYLKGGKKVFENMEFKLELPDENERIVSTDLESLELVHWYDRYFLLMGSQRIRYLKENGSGATRDVFFVTKVLVAGDLYQSESVGM